MTLATVLIIIAAALVTISAHLLLRALRAAEQERLERSWRRARDQERS